jgi:polyhydroxyalkanoate synthesis regulator phasin
MAISTAEYDQIKARLTKLENAFNQLATAQNSLVSVNQVSQIYTVMQTQMESLQTTVDSLETRVEDIENEPIR